MKIILTLALWCCFNLNLGYAKDITVASDIWCPYICQDTLKPGYIVEMLNDILNNKNFTINNETMPLARAIKLLKSGNIDIVLGLTQQHIDHHKLTYSNISVGDFANDFFVNDSNSWRFSTMEKLEEYASDGHKIGIIKGYFYGVEVSKLITKRPDLFLYSYGNHPLRQNIERLRLARIDILLDSKNTVMSEISRLKLPPLAYAGTQGTKEKLYIALSKTAAPQLLKIINQGIIEYRRSGKLMCLLARYGISDWQEEPSSQCTIVH